MRRWLGAELEQLRRDVGLTQRQAAKALGWGLGKIGYIESGERPISVPDLRDHLLLAYRVPEPEHARYIEMADAANARAWWDEYDDEDLPRAFKHYAGLEQGANSMRTFEFGVFPGLLQTEEYAAAVVRRRQRVIPKATDSEAGVVEVRLRRQQILSGSDPLELWAVLDEAVLRRSPGDLRIMRAQIEHVAYLAEQRPNVHVRVIEFDAGLHEAMGGPFVILGFPRAGDPGTVFLESGPTGMRFLDARREVYAFSRVFDHLIELALDDDASIAMMRRVASECGG